jgi:penicillin-binding protein 1A
MQVARNFFLSSEKTLSRKLYEALLAFKIEHNLAKDEILQIYINQIYLGQRAYGFSSASQIYYGNLKASAWLKPPCWRAAESPSASTPWPTPARCCVSF